MLERLDHWLDKFVGLAALSPSAAAYVRAEQIASIVKLTPMMMAGNVVGALILLSVFRTGPEITAILIWASLVILLALFAMRNWWQFKTQERRKKASRRGIAKASINGLVLGSIWGATPLLTLPSSSSTQHLIVYVMMAGMICGGGFALSAIPQAVLSFLVPVLIGSTFGLIYSAEYMQLFVAILFVTFAGIIITASLSHSRTFIGRIVAQTESDERGAVIGMLLKNFEENSSDWLWSTDAQGRLERVSERFAGAAGRVVEDLQGQPFLHLFEKPQSQKHPGLWYRSGMHAPSYGVSRYRVAGYCPWQDALVAHDRPGVHGRGRRIYRISRGRIRHFGS